MTKPRQPSALERLDVLEKRFPLFVQSVREAFKGIENRVQAVEKVLAAVMEVLGAQVVNDKILELHHAELEATADNNEKAVQDAVERGEMKEHDVIDADNVLIVSQEKNEKGDVVHPTRLFNVWDGYKANQDLHEKLEGKKVGDTVEMADKHTVTIKALYLPVPPEERPKPEEPEADGENDAPAGPTGDAEAPAEAEAEATPDKE